MLLVVIFTYAFFKFSWAMRQLGQGATLIGRRRRNRRGAPSSTRRSSTHRAHRFVCGHNFNNGLRAYYFGLAALAWFLIRAHVIATAWVISVLYAREFRSKTLKRSSRRTPAISFALILALTRNTKKGVLWDAVDPVR